MTAQNLSPSILAGESAPQASSRDEIDQALGQLSAARPRWTNVAIGERIRLARDCLAGVGRVAEAWVAAACQAKGVDPASPAAAEEMAAGPLAVSRYLALLIGTLTDIERDGRPQLPGKILTGPAGQLRVPVFPARGLYDALLFRGFRAHAWMQPHVTPHNLAEHLAGAYRRRAGSEATALVLGAGNVSAIPATDALGRLFQENRVVLLKMNPVNDYLGEIFESAFRELIAEGVLRIIHGGAETGAYAIGHARVDEVHITGSAQAHDAIVWGAPGDDRDRRMAMRAPKLDKPISSELGNVTPWIVVPGPYTRRQLDFQAENVAAMIVNNASFNCIAAKVLVTWRGWDAREEFLARIRRLLAGIPRRRAYYPGAAERFQRFAGNAAGGPAEPQSGLDAGGALPWTLVEGIDAGEASRWFSEESFVCVCGETSLEAADAEQFLQRAVDFCNERLWGTLGAGLMVHPSLRRGPGSGGRFWRAVGRLRYGTVAINHWPGLAYVLMTLPWGGYPGASLEDPQSGIGWVHNTYLLDGVEKSVLEGPLTVYPKPLWFPSHRRGMQLARRVLDLYQHPAWWKLPGVFAAALRG